MTNRARSWGGSKAPADRLRLLIENGFDVFADKQGGAGGGLAEAHGPAVDTPKRFARAGEVGFGGTFGVEPRALHALGGAPLAGVDGGNERNARASSMARCSDAPPVRGRMRSSRYPCLLVAASVHFSGMPGRLSAQRASAPWRRLCRRLSVSALFAAAEKVAAADVCGSYTQRSGNFSGVHGARFLWGAMA